MSIHMQLFIGLTVANVKILYLYTIVCYIIIDVTFSWNTHLERYKQPGNLLESYYNEFWVYFSKISA